jgi:hypothetical protein
MPINLSILTDAIPTYQAFLPTIRPSDGRQQGQPMTVSGHPAQHAIISAMDSGRWRKFAWAKPVQDGGTLIGLVPMLRRAALERQRVVLAYPTWESAKAIWETKVWPVLESFGGQKPIKGAGSRGGSAQRTVHLPGGGMFLLRAAGGRGESGQASITGDCLLVDETDDWPSMHRLELIAQRINESIDPLCIYCCTVKSDIPVGQEGASLILSLVSNGTDGRLEYPCHSCGQYFPNLWESIDIKRAVHICPGCEAVTDERQRLDAFRRYKLVMQSPTAEMWTLLWSALDSPRITVHKLVEQYTDALRFVEKNDHGPMRSFYRDRLARGYLGDRQDAESQDYSVTPKMLAHRSDVHGWAPTEYVKEEDGASAYHRAIDVPEISGRSIVAGAVDVQGDRVYWSAGIIDSQGRSWDMAWGYRHGNADRQPWRPGELGKTLQHVSDLIASLAAEWRKPFGQGVVDIRFATDDIGLWLEGQTHWRAITGFDHLPKVSIEVALQGQLVWQPNWRNGLGCWQISNGETTAEARLALHQSYKINPESGGASILPSDLRQDNAYLQHLAANRYEMDHKRNKMRWIKKRVRNDWLDCRVYWWSVGRFLMARHEARQEELPPDEQVKLPVAQPAPAQEDQKPPPAPAQTGDAYGYELGGMG